MARLFLAMSLLTALTLGSSSTAAAQDAKECISVTSNTNWAGSHYVFRNTCSYDVVVRACQVGDGTNECGVGRSYFAWAWYFSPGERVTFGDGKRRYRFAACRDHETVYLEIDVGPNGRYGCRTPGSGNLDRSSPFRTGW